MTLDISQEAYERYRGLNESLNRVLLHMRKGKTAPTKTYEEWVEVVKVRDHPRWPDYIQARRDWKASVFHIVYSPSVVSSPLPPFPSFEQWLAAQEDVTKDYPALIEKDKA